MRLALIDSSRCSGEACTVFEYCGGGNLATYYRTPTFTKNEFARIYLELLSGMCFLHERDIAHLQLRPENVRFKKMILVGNIDQYEFLFVCARSQILLEERSRSAKISGFGLTTNDTTFRITPACEPR